MARTWEELESIQSTVLNIFRNSIRKDRMAHAYLFEGMKGTGKREVALLVAKSIFCESPQDDVIPCEQCVNCKRINHGNHPDLHIVEPDGQSIKKQQIQQLQEEFSKKGVESQQKLYIIVHADRMTVNAANSLLKFLEEPHAQTYAILLTEQLQRILPTILSRCQSISFKPLPAQILISKLVESGVNPQKAPIYAQLTNNLDEAISLSHDDWFAQAQKIVVKLYEVLQNKPLEAMIFLQEEWFVHFKDKEQYDRGFDLLLLLLKDLLYIQIGKHNRIADISNKALLEQYALKTAGRQLTEQMTCVLGAKRKLAANMNLQLLMEQLVLRLQEGSSVV